MKWLIGCTAAMGLRPGILHSVKVFFSVTTEKVASVWVTDIESEGMEVWSLPFYLIS